jgi:hypothetical protein
MNGDQLSANVDACLLALWRQCPGGGADNIHAIYLQPSNSSPSLPIYAHFGMSLSLSRHFSLVCLPFSSLDTNPLLSIKHSTLPLEITVTFGVMPYGFFSKNYQMATTKQQ